MGEEKNKRQSSVLISNEVIAQYAGNAAMECFGIVGIGAVKDGLWKLLKLDRLSKGISVQNQDGELTIDFHIIVAYYVSIQAVCQNLIESVAYQVESFTGLSVKKINVYVEGVRYVE